MLKTLSTACAFFASAALWAQEEKPLLTIGCVSDFHNASSLIQHENVNDMTVRGSLPKVCQGMHDAENLDIMLVGGDCTSECDLSIEMFDGFKQLFRRTTATAFQDPNDKPVLITTGNHDYEAARKDAYGHRLYSSGDFYTGFMEHDVGTLTDEDSFFESGTHNGGSMRMRAAYYYKVKGYDFISLNCGKHEFDASSNYQYSMESVQWVANKLEQITKDDPYKTIFFFLHIPFCDSNSLRYEYKGIRYSPAENLLKKTLAKYPNLIMLYGHDHGSDRAYSRRSTAQRITLYNTDGQVIPTFDENHVEGTTEDPNNDYCNLQQKFYLQSVASRKYMCKDSDLGLALMDGKRCPVFFTRNAYDGTFTLSINENSISYEENHFHEGISTPMFAFEVQTLADGNLAATKKKEIEVGKTYVFAYRTGRYYYAIASTPYAGDNRNLVAVKLQGTGDNITFTTDENNKVEELAWIIRDDSSAKQYYIRADRGEGCLNTSGANLGLDTNDAISIIRRSNDDEALFNIQVESSGSDTDGGRQVRNGTGGNFSLNKVGSDFMIYHIIDPDSRRATAVRTDVIESGEHYALVGRSQVDPTQYYLLSNQENTSTHRMNGSNIVPNETITISNSTKLYSWTLEEVQENLDASFFSAFMGSLRYYSNVTNTDMVQTATPDIVQALMIYVYDDRVVLQMKNYNKTGKFSSVMVNKELATYTAYRKTKPAEDGIETITTHSNYDNNYYDLLGRRVSYPEAGVYIKNGKKIIIK